TSTGFGLKGYRCPRADPWTRRARKSLKWPDPQPARRFRFAAAAPFLPSAVRVFAGRCAILRLRFGAPRAFLPLRRRAALCRAAPHEPPQPAGSRAACRHGTPGRVFVRPRHAVDVGFALTAEEDS